MKIENSKEENVEESRPKKARGINDILMLLLLQQMLLPFAVLCLLLWLFSSGLVLMA